MYYSLRITKPTLPQLLSLLLTKSYTYVLGGYEMADTSNQHYHVLIEITGKKDSFIKWLKDNGIIDAGNGSYSCRVVLEGTESVVAQYVSKEHLYSSNHTVYTREWLVKNPYVPKTFKEKTKPVSWPAVVVTAWKKHKQSLHHTQHDIEKECIRWTVKFFVENLKIFDSFIIRRFANLCLGSTDLNSIQMRIIRKLEEN